MKSECYRIFHSKEVYLLTVIFTVLITVFNLIHYFCAQSLPGFQYANTAFTYGAIDTAMTTFIYIIIVICSMLDGSSIRNMKNSAAFGTDRKVIYFGRMMTQSIICIVMYLYLMGLHLLLGKLLLEDSGKEATQIFIRSAIVCIPMFLGVVAAYHCCIFLNKNAISAAAIMIIILTVVPMGMKVLGYKLSGVKKVSDMLMYNLMQVEYVETAEGYLRKFSWDTTAGIVKCIIAGICAILIFSLIGTKYFQKKEIR